MNFLAKVFVVLTLLLSIVFLGVTSTLFMGRKRLREQVADLRKQREGLQGEYAEYKTNKDAELKTLGKEKQDLERDLAARTSEVQRLTSENTNLRAVNDNLLGNVNQQKTQLTGLQNSLGRITERHDATVEELKATQEDLAKYRKEAATLADNVKDLDGKNKKLAADLHASQTQGKELTEQVKSYESLVQQLKDRGIELKKLAPGGKTPPLVDGKVLVVNEDLGFVIANVGLPKDGKEPLKPGFEMVVYRDEGFVARVLVEKVFGELAKLRILKKWQKLPVREGDDVTTKVLKDLP